LQLRRECAAQDEKQRERAGGYIIDDGHLQGGKRSADYYVAGLSLIFDLFPTGCQPGLIPPLWRTGDGVKSVHPLARHISVMKYT